MCSPPKGFSTGGQPGQTMDHKNNTSLMLKRLQKAKQFPITSITGNQSELSEQFLQSQNELKESLKELNKRKTNMFKCKAAYITQQTKIKLNWKWRFLKSHKESKMIIYCFNCDCHYLIIVLNG